MPAAWVGAAVAVAGAYDSYSQGQDAADRAESAQEKMDDAAAKAEQRFEDYYAPIEKQITAEAAKGYTPDYTGRAARIQADVGRAFDESREIGNRARSRYGVGEGEGYNKDVDIARALSEVDSTNRAYTDERNRADTLGFDRQYKTLQLGYKLPSEATGLYQTAANTASNQAAAYSRDAAAGANAVGQFASRAANQWGGGASDTQAAAPVEDRSIYGANYGSPSNDPYGGGDYSALGNYNPYGQQAAPVATSYPYQEYYAEGGPVIGNTLEDDAIPARLTHGEFVTDPETVAYYGLKHFEELKRKAQEGMAQIRQNRSR